MVAPASDPAAMRYMAPYPVARSASAYGPRQAVLASMTICQHAAAYREIKHFSGVLDENILATFSLHSQLSGAQR